MGIIQTIIAFILSLGILVSIHEWGHFWVARRAGVKVLKFSIGFGKSLFTWHDKYGTEFCIAIIPLGGYVKMLDEREEDVPIEEVHLAFNKKSVWARIAIVAAGPIANLLLAIIALWLMYIIGIKTIVPTIGSIIPHSPASYAGMTANTKITQINNQDIHSWNDVNLLLAGSIGETKPFTITTSSPTKQKTYTVEIKHWPSDLETQSLLDTLGVKIWSPSILPIIGRLIPNLPGEQAGLQPNDQIIAINGAPIITWNNMVKDISHHPNKPLTLSIKRGNQPLTISVTPEEKTLSNGKKIGFIGIEAKPTPWPKDQIQTLSYNPLTAFGVAALETWKLTRITTQSLFKIITGILSVNNLSGPITIAKIAGTSLQSGLENFLYFIAMLSVSLGVINLLPIPALDGGHLLY